MLADGQAHVRGGSGIADGYIVARAPAHGMPLIDDGLMTIE